jgi:hypothetical protein
MNASRTPTAIIIRPQRHRPAPACVGAGEPITERYGFADLDLMPS